MSLRPECVVSDDPDFIFVPENTTVTLTGDKVEVSVLVHVNECRLPHAATIQFSIAKVMIKPQCHFFRAAGHQTDRGEQKNAAQ